MQAELQDNRSRAEEAKVWPVLSLFSGAGGLDLGFRQAGFWPGLAIDLDPAAVSTYRWNQPGTHVAPLDIAASNAEEFVDLWTEINGEMDLSESSEARRVKRSQFRMCIRGIGILGVSS